MVFNSANWRSSTRTDDASDIMRSRRSLKNPNEPLSRTSNPGTDRNATKAARSDGCSYARELMPRNVTRPPLRGGGVVPPEPALVPPAVGAVFFAAVFFAAVFFAAVFFAAVFFAAVFFAAALAAVLSAAMSLTLRPRL